MKNYFILISIGIFSIVQYPILQAQIKTYKFEQIDSLQKIEKRNVMVFIHTDWCKYCKAMKNTTLVNEKVIATLNEKFYFIDFDAEDKRSIVFNHQNFQYKPSGFNTGVHELAIELATIDNKVSYPSLCFLNSNNEIIFQYSEFINEKNLISLLSKLN